MRIGVIVMKKRIFNIMQYEYHPDNAYDEDGNLIPGAEPLLSQKQIDDGLRHRCFKRWAYIWHDKDVYTEQDEKKNPRHRAGEPKRRHAHIVIQCDDAIEVSDVARWFGIPENFIHLPKERKDDQESEEGLRLPKGRGAFLDCVRYLTHEDEKQQALGKTLYPDDAVVANFDWRAEVDKYVAGRMKPADVMRMHVLRDGWTLKQCRDTDPLTYSKIRSSLPPLRLDYLFDAEPCQLRITIYVDGDSGIGKSSFCQYIAQALFQGNDDPYFCIGGDERVTFDGYDGQPVIIWDDMRASDFIKQFKPQGTYRILDPYPQKIAQQAKHSRVILTNAINIINGIQPFEEFIAGLAGTYTDKRTGMHYQAEDETQAWRRFPLIFCVHEDNFDILMNEGFVNRDMSAVKRMISYGHVRGSWRSAMQQLEGAAKDKVLLDFSRPALEAVDKVKKSQDVKISDPAQIPPEFADYGKLMTDDEVKQLKEYRLIDKADDYATRCDEALLDFAEWFWSDIRSRVPSLAHDQRMESALANEENIRAALKRFVDSELVETFPMNEILRVVMTWWLNHQYIDPNERMLVYGIWDAGEEPKDYFDSYALKAEMEDKLTTLDNPGIVYNPADGQTTEDGDSSLGE